MSENDLKRDYPRIYLTDELGEVNWCQDRITKEDVPYIRSDLAKKLAGYAEHMAGCKVFTPHHLLEDCTCGLSELLGQVMK